MFPPLTYLRPIRAAREEHGGKGVIVFKKGAWLAGSFMRVRVTRTLKNLWAILFLYANGS